MDLLVRLGPAFEGAPIRDGMRAAHGAIERVGYLDGTFHVQTVGGAAPTGICGSGILDAVAAALEAGIVKEREGGSVESTPWSAPSRAFLRAYLSLLLRRPTVGTL